MRFSFHNHTDASHDCRTSLRRLEDRCVERGIDAIAITDHHTAVGAFRAAREFTKVRVIVGQEIETDRGELIGLFLKEEIPSGLSVAETISRAHGQGGLIIVPHPFDRLRRHVLSQEALMEHLNDIDAIETFNARCVYKEDNAKAAAFAASHKKRAIAGNDAHTVKELGSTIITIDDFSDGKSFLRSLETARFETKLSPLWVHGVTKAVKLGNRLRKPRKNPR